MAVPGSPGPLTLVVAAVAALLLVDQRPTSFDTGVPSAVAGIETSPSGDVLSISSWWFATKQLSFWIGVLVGAGFLLGVWAARRWPNLLLQAAQPLQVAVQSNVVIEEISATRHVRAGRFPRRRGGGVVVLPIAGPPGPDILSR